MQSSKRMRRGKKRRWFGDWRRNSKSQGFGRMEVPAKEMQKHGQKAWTLLVAERSRLKRTTGQDVPTLDSRLRNVEEMQTAL